MTSQNFSSKFKLLLVAGVVALGGLGFLVASSFGGDSTESAPADTAAATQQSANKASASTTKQSAQDKVAVGAYFGGASGKGVTSVGLDSANFSVNAYGPVWHISQPTEEDYLNLDSPQKAKARNAFSKLATLYTDEYNRWEEHTKQNYVNYFFPVNEEAYKQAQKSIGEIFIPLDRAEGWSYSKSKTKGELEAAITLLMPAVYPFLVADAPNLAQDIATDSFEKLNVQYLVSGAKDNPRTETAYLEPIDLPTVLQKANKYLREYEDYVGEVTPAQANQFLWYFANADIVKEYTVRFSYKVRERLSNYLKAAHNDTTVPYLKDKILEQLKAGKIDESTANKYWGSVQVLASEMTTSLYITKPGAYEIGEYLGALAFVPAFPAQCQVEDYPCVENALKEQILKAKQLRGYLSAGSYLQKLKEQSVFDTKALRFEKSDAIRRLLHRYTYKQN